MTAKVRFGGKPAVACCTYVGTLFGVNAHVILQMVSLRERSPANRAHEWPFARVGELVALQIGTLGERLWTQVTRKRALSSVSTAVVHLVASPLRRVAAQAADV